MQPYDTFVRYNSFLTVFVGFDEIKHFTGGAVVKAITRYESNKPLEILVTFAVILSKSSRIFLNNGNSE